jgi:Cadherin cytoplasmic region.
MVCSGKCRCSKCPVSVNLLSVSQIVVVSGILLVLLCLKILCLFLGTDEGDLKFDYLSNFGPRFRKLADMYGEDPSDDDDDDENFNTPASESWC